jgi:hypothetical protein
MVVKRKDLYIDSRDVHDKERVTIRETEKLRRISLNLTLEDSDLEDSFDLETPKQGHKYFLSPLLCQLSPLANLPAPSSRI